MIRFVFRSIVPLHGNFHGGKERFMLATKEYDAKIDVKKRVTIRGAHFDHYHVIEYPDGKIALEPRELVAPFGLAAIEFSE